MKNGAFKNYQGTKDYVSLNYSNGQISSETFRFVENEFTKWVTNFGFTEMILPTIENSKLYNRSVGESSDIVQKEMFTITSNKDEIALRPEGTAGVIRSYIQNKLYTSPNETVKLFYRGSMFRRERPQAGRQREFTQLGLEAIGIDSPYVDAEVISLASNFLRKLGLENIKLEINSIGCSACRSKYIESLKMYIDNIEDLCDDCNNRKEKNVLRVLDCKNESCQKRYKNAPLISNYLCDNCENDFITLKTALNLLNITFNENPKLVRGLDYYTKTAFEFIDTSIGAQSTVCGGGRYSGLVRELGGPDNSGIGFGIGLERLLISLTNQGKLPEIQSEIDYYLVWTNEETKNIQFKILQNLREKGFKTEMEFTSKKLKNQLKVADRKKAKFALILGETELEKGLIQVKNLSTGEQLSENIKEWL